LYINIHWHFKAFVCGLGIVSSIQWKMIWIFNRKYKEGYNDDEWNILEAPAENHQGLMETCVMLAVKKHLMTYTSLYIYCTYLIICMYLY
jgi:hypothetical protein